MSEDTTTQSLWRTVPLFERFQNGEVIQRKGVIPDIEVYATMETIMEGKDEILEEAIRYINNLK
ncbi:MAG: hypothetical protein FWG22_03170 [Prolixibacteraceae bacterium]|nr:hypothetical protein [Prolixibacteraceae bacterium]